MPPTGSVSRILNVLAVLAERREPIAFERLCALVPDYRVDWEKHQALGANQDRATSRPFQSLKRKFERDKDMLLRLGVQVQWEERIAGQDHHGRPLYESFLSLSRRNFFSQYNSLHPSLHAGRRRSALSSALKINREDTALLMESVTVLAEEVDPALTEAAARAMVKLTRESRLPKPTNGKSVICARPRTNTALQGKLLTALQRRKSVTFVYGSPYRPNPRTRRVDAYGLFCDKGHWYLCGWDHERRGIRKFRIDRMKSLKVETRRPQTPDYTLPKDFSLADYAGIGMPWEFSDAEAVEVGVNVLADRAVESVVKGGGRMDDTRPGRAVFSVKGQEEFFAWIARHRHEMRLEPNGPLAEPWQDWLRSMHAKYDTPAAHDDALSRVTAQTPRITRPEAAPAQDTVQQLARIAVMIQLFGDNAYHKIAHIARKLGMSTKEVLRDLDASQDQTHDLAGYMAPIHIEVDRDDGEVLIRAPKALREVILLDSAESAAVVLGLRILRAESSGERQHAIDRVLAIVERLTNRGERGVERDEASSENTAPYEATRSMSTRDREKMQLLVRAIEQQRPVEMGYRSANAPSATVRTIHPYNLAVHPEGFHVIAFCEKHQRPIPFRSDRIHSLTKTTRPRFEVDASYDVRQFLQDDGRLRVQEGAQRVVVRFTDAAARMVAEEYLLDLDENGSLVWSYPLLDDSWAVTHVLQYGTSAEILSPSAMRQRMREQLQQLIDLAPSCR